ncbi:MAG: TIGR02996 domain-containing protein [Planctomycetales bacterium]
MEKAFLAEIVENPEDDDPRLVYADWLEERGEPRAEFIRVQCEHAQMKSVAPTLLPEWNRENRLLHANERRWMKELRPFLINWTFERGFVEQVCMRGSVVLSDGDRVFGRSPIRELRIKGQDAPLKKIAWAPCLRRLRSLVLDGGKATLADVEALSRSPFADNLAVLKLPRLHLGDAGALILANAQLFPKLTVLDLRGDDAGFTAKTVKRLKYRFGEGLMLTGPSQPR